MIKQSRQQLEQQFADIATVTIEQAPNTADDTQLLLRINHPACGALISVQGAQILRFAPTNNSDWLWLSEHADFTPGAAIRGGIPVCLPWFGVNRQNPDLPKHGVARNQPWQLVDVTETRDDICLIWRLDHVADHLFGHDFRAELSIEMGKQLSLSLTIKHLGDTTAAYSFALHSYLRANASEVEVSGLEGNTYLDNTQGLSTHTQHGNIVFDGEVDRVYANTHQAQILHTAFPRVIEGDGCPTCIVWNPGKQLGLTMADVQTGWQDYVCVERGAAFDDEVTLAPQTTLTATMTLKQL
ncbi:Putative glucose-6-phosphate 1-epimerase [BD1-7 clade bacterium]|uniref:Putative glucose-6-phosphate 1-epimerase n=1 Tax=BD1-7 clade bacterium TaxID=2029982 RepID=A0A5S9QCA8_9GAMM|nr:Putative glucose-6-phosphate 1-epimerase [BD1-7 clade bacterium]